MTPTRFALWAAVSTIEQAADDKASIPAQLSEGRRVANEKGWQETAGPFVVSGKSRTRWASLEQAEVAIPELRAMLDAAKRRDFDVLVTKDYDRFRELLSQVFYTLNDYGVQLYSLAQAIEPAPPETFDPFANDSQELLIGFSMMRSRVEVRTSRRRFRVGMPDRATKHGLPVIIPYGYHKPIGHEADRKAVPVPDGAIVHHIVAAKDLFLGSHSLRQIAETLQAAGAPTPGGQGRWHMATVRGILRNPFYAGIVRWGASKTHLDRRTGKRSKERNLLKNAVEGPGKHEPLWDEATYLAILAEFKRREHRYSGRRAAALSGLLRCGLCGGHMWVNYRFRDHNAHHPDNIIWHCGSCKPGHVTIPNPVALQLVVDEIIATLRGDRPADAGNPAPDHSDELADLLARRKRVSDAYDDGTYSLPELHARRDPIDARITELEAQAQDTALDAAEAELQAETLAYLTEHLDKLEAVLVRGNAQAANHILKIILQDVTVQDDQSVQVSFRG